MIKIANIHSPMELQMEDLDRIISIFDNITKHENDRKWAETVTDELYIYQPFLLSVMMGFKFDLSPEELAEATTLHIAIWEYFKIDPKVKSKKITMDQFQRLVDSNMQLQAKKPQDIIEVALLFNVIIERFGKRPVLSRMKTQSKGQLIIGTKSFIECFQELIS